MSDTRIRAWRPVETDGVEEALKDGRDPLRRLVEADIPAIILRDAYPAAACAGLVSRFIERGLMRDPRQPAPPDAPLRIDIGTSLGNRGHDQPAFFAHARQSRELFATLFDGFPDPVDRLYGILRRLAGDKQVVTAREPDGRLYGPAIFRIHYDSQFYAPHIDHVVLREKRFDYAVSRYPVQLAGVLCLQNAASAAATQADPAPVPLVGGGAAPPGGEHLSRVRPAPRTGKLPGGPGAGGPLLLQHRSRPRGAGRRRRLAQDRARRVHRLRRRPPGGLRLVLSRLVGPAAHPYLLPTQRVFQPFEEPPPMVNFSVELSDDEPFERALRRFTSKTKRTGLMRDLKRKRFFTKPSVQKKLDLQKSIRRRKKAERIARLAEMGLDRRGRKRR